MSETADRLKVARSLIKRANTTDDCIVQEVIHRDVYHFSNINLNTNKPVIIDVGAHIGAFSKWASVRYPNAMILSFEANPLNFDILEENLKNSNNIKLFKGPLLGEEPADKKVIIQEGHEYNTGGYGVVGKGSLSPFTYVGFGKVYLVKDIIKEMDLFTIDFLKLDCEGSEFSILNSMTEKLLNRTSYISMEFHPAQFESSVYQGDFDKFKAYLLKHFYCDSMTEKPSDCMLYHLSKRSLGEKAKFHDFIQPYYL